MTLPRSSLPRPVCPHCRQIALPEAASPQIKDAMGLDPANVVLQGSLHDAGIGLFAAQTGGLLEQLLIEHKICTFHVFNIHHPKRLIKPSRGLRCCLGTALLSLKEWQSPPARTGAPPCRCPPARSRAALRGGRAALPV